MDGKFIRFYPKGTHSEYGSYLWIGRVRFGSPGTMTPMWPHVYKSGDEYCNDVLAFHLYPLVSVDIWWRRKQRTAEDGLCEKCKQEMRDAGWTEDQIMRTELWNYLAPPLRLGDDRDRLGQLQRSAQSDR